MKKKAAFFTDSPEMLDYVFAQGRAAELAELTELYPTVISQANFAEHRTALADIEVIFSTWGMWPLSDQEFAAMPKLRAVYYAAGATDGFARPLFRHGVELYGSWLANAIPVAEFCAAQIVLSLKGYFRNSADFTRPENYRLHVGPGCYGETVALIGAGAISQKVQELLQPYRIKLLVVPSRPERRTVSLEEAFARSMVVSNHLPNRADNVHVFGEALFRSMRQGATFINTGRGAQVDEAAMCKVLRERPDLSALLDVTWPEPPPAGSELYRLPNVHLSGHIAGSFHDEVVRMADFMLDEFKRCEAGEEPWYRITEDMLMTN